MSSYLETTKNSNRKFCYMHSSSVGLKREETHRNGHRTQKAHTSGFRGLLARYQRVLRVIRNILRNSVSRITPSPPCGVLMLQLTNVDGDRVPSCLRCLLFLSDITDSVAREAAHCRATIPKKLSFSFITKNNRFTWRANKHQFEKKGA